MMKKNCTAPTPGCKCYRFVHVCRPQNIMFCLGKRCKANCTFSAEKYTWFTVWKLPPNHFMCSLTTNKTKQNIKDQSSSPPQTSGSFKTPLRSLSVHYQSIFIDIGMSLHLQFIVVPSHTVRSKCDKGNCANRGPLSPVMRFQAGKAKFPGNDIQNNETIPMCCVCSVHRSNTRCDCPSSVCIQSLRARHIYIQSVFLCGARSPNLFRWRLHHPSLFFLFLFFFAVTFQLLPSSKQVLLKDSH